MWLFPLKMERLGPTEDSMSFQKIDIERQVEIPVNPHVGSFGVERRHDIHKGVDLYCPEGTPVYAVEDGVLCDLRPFTGERIGQPWWEETWAASVVGESGVVVYGEINHPVFESMEDVLDDGKIYMAPREVKRGDLIGHVKRVLKKDKGRPRSMLHLAMHKHGVLTNGTWNIGDPQPPGLLDPTELLLGSEPF
jgi:hypothetical protein